MSAYGISTKLDVSYEQAIESTTEALKQEGFGVLTEIDVKKTLKQKIDVDFRKYVILGACNPSFAHQALQAELELGLLLPCNVIVYEEGDHTVVSAINPIVAMGIVENEQLREIAGQVYQKLCKVIESLGQ